MNPQVDMVSIGEFARMTRLSPKALRLYDEMGLLVPARVDPESGYRWYEVGQVGAARLVAALRRIGMPLAEIVPVLSAAPEGRAARVAAYWAGAEAEHGHRRQLAAYLVDQLNGDGRGATMFEVTTRHMPARRILCLERHVSGEPEVWALGKEFIGLFRERPAPRMVGRTGAWFLIYHGEVSEDSDGPVEFCRPVPDEDAVELAALYPSLTLRDEPAHEEAVVHIGTEPSGTQWEMVSESLRAWAVEHRREPTDLGVRLTYLVIPPLTAQSVPDLDFAVPFR